MTSTRTQPSIRQNAASYPVADMNTARLVDKLRQRGTQTQVVRASSSALIEDEYHSARQARQGQQPKQFDNNYSPYSNVNAEAVAEARKRADEKRRAEKMAQQRQRIEEIRQTQARQTMPMQMQVQTAHQPQRRQNGVAVAGHANHTQVVTKSQSRKYYGEGQLADSGPREVAQRRVPFPKLAIVLLLMFVVLFFMVHSIVRNYEYKQEISRLQAQVTALSERAALLTSELNERDDYSYIEQQATEIGMIKDSNTEKKYIDLSGSDVIENFGGEDDDYGTLSTMLSAISRRLSRFLGGDD